MTEVYLLIRLIEEVSGNVVQERDYARTGLIAEERARSAGCKDLHAYLKLLERDQDGDEWRALLSQITINESYLFRTPLHFDTLATMIIPELTERRPQRCLRLWSAGCARGEEAATLAIVLAESACLVGWQWSVLATDVDETVLNQARRGLYGARAVSKVPTHLLERYFEPRGDLFELKSRLRQRIEYRNVNLMREPLMVPSSYFDLIFFRNVLIYFRPSSQQRVARAVADTMVDDGYLFLGTSESLWQLCPELKAMDLGSCFCYRKTPQSATGGEDPGPGSSVSTAGTAPGAANNTPAKATTSGRWQRSTAPEPPVAVSNRAVVTRGDTHRMLVNCLSGEDIETAKVAVQEALQRFPEDAVVRAFEGLCHDLGGAPDAAVRAYRAALYLDPSLFQVRLLLARCLEQKGMAERARNEHREVYSLLASSGASALPGSEVLGLPSEAQARIRISRRSGS